MIDEDHIFVVRDGQVKIMGIQDGSSQIIFTLPNKSVSVTYAE